MAGGGTTGGGAFRYPYDLYQSVTPLMQKLKDTGQMDEWEDSIDAVMATLLDRDRAMEDYLTVAAAAVGSFFDAIVDGTLSTSDSSNRIFKGIMEAVSYLGALGKTDVTIGVKPAGLTGYQETASVTTGIPTRVRLIGAGQAPANTDSSSNVVVWDLRGRRFEFVQIMCENMTLRSSNALSNGATDLFNSASMTNLTLINCMVLSNSTFMNALNNNSNDCRIFLHNTAMSNMAYGRGRWVYHLGGEMAFSSTYTFTTVCQPSAQPTGGDMNCYLSGVNLLCTSGTANVTWNNSNSESVVLAGCAVIDRGQILLIPQSTTLGLTFVGRPCVDIHNSSGTNATKVTVTFSSTTGGASCELSGAEGANSGLTIFTKTGTNPCSFKGDVTSFDITGPARVQTTHNTATGSSSGILRGNGIVADIVMRSNAAVGLSCIGMTQSLVRACFVSGITPTKAYDLDATSNNNICDFAGASNGTNPGTDNGAGNIIRQT